MKTTLSVFGVILGLSSAVLAANTPPAASAGAVIGQHVPPFKAELVSVGDKTPQTTPFDSEKTKHITAYVFVGTTCPATNAYVDRFKALEQTYGPKGVEFIYIYPNGSDTHDVQVKFHKDKGFHGPLIDDHGAHLAHVFDAKRTTEIFLTDKQGTVVFHGGVDDSREPKAITKQYLSTALDELLAGKAITTSTTDVFA